MYHLLVSVVFVFLFFVFFFRHMSVRPVKWIGSFRLGCTLTTSYGPVRRQSLLILWVDHMVFRGNGDEDQSSPTGYKRGTIEN